MKKSPQLSKLFRILADAPRDDSRALTLKDLAYRFGEGTVKRSAAQFDTDMSRVRSLISRLRNTLETFFSTDGRHLDLRVTIPNGRYSLEFARSLEAESAQGFPFWAPYKSDSPVEVI